MDVIRDRLRTLRKEIKLNQEDIANAIHVARGTYASYENGVTPPTTICIKLSQYFSVSIDYLLGLSNERKPASGTLPAHFAELARLAETAALTATDIDAVLTAAAQYYRNGAPCGNIPLDALRGFLDGLRKALDAAARRDAAATLEAVNAATVSALSVTKMPMALYEVNDK